MICLDTEENFSVFGIVGTIIEKNVLASDGTNDRVSVLCDPEAAAVRKVAEEVCDEVLERYGMNPQA